MLRYRTVEQIAKRLKRRFIPPVETIFMNEAGKLPTIFAVPGIGGFAMHFVHLARALGHDQPLTVFPDVSFAARDLSIEAESARISLLMDEIQPDGWISLMGFSAGGIIALEITRHLVSRNRDVNLILIDAGIYRF